jgi:signal peptidase I
LDKKPEHAAITIEKTNAAQKKTKRRSEAQGIFNFSKEMISALLMAFVAIVYVIQAFKIPTGSMEDSLLVGDFLLGLKFIYGAPVVPFSYTKLPGITKPKSGDVVIFKYPGNDKKDYIKRCVAGPGQVLEIHGEQVKVNGVELKLPVKGKYVNNGATDPHITEFEKLRIPARGDTILVDTCKVREFLFLKNLVHQEHPRSQVTMKFDLFVDSVLSNNRQFTFGNGAVFTFEQIPLNQIDNWVSLATFAEQIKQNASGHVVDIRPQLFLEGKRIFRYIVKNDNYFMMGDNRDNSLDSRFWGYVNKNFVKAKAFIVYFSLDKDTPYYLLPLKIRWERIGKLIRSWDGIHSHPAIKW